MKSKLMEAFKAGNRARKKESATDSVQFVEGPVHKIVKDFNEKFKSSLFVEDGRPYSYDSLILCNMCELTELPDNLTVEGSLVLAGSSNLKKLPKGLCVWGDYFNICGTGLTEFPDDLQINSKTKIVLNTEEMRDFFKDKIPQTAFSQDALKYAPIPNIPGRFWMEWRENHMNEAFKTGNRARKKESVQDQTEETVGRQKTRYTREELDKSNISKAIAESVWKWCPEIFTAEAVGSPKWEDTDEWGGGNTVYIDDLSGSGFNTGYIPIGDSDLSVSGIWIYFNLGYYSDPSKKGTFFINVEVYDELTADKADLIRMGFTNDAGYWEGNQIQIGMKDMPDGLKETLYKTDCEVFGDYWGYEPETADASVLEAFRAGNRARKKEAVQDTAAVTDLPPYTDIEGIRDIIGQYGEFPCVITDKDHPVHITISSEAGNTYKIQDLSFKWKLEMAQHLDGGTENGFTTNGNIMRLDLYIDEESPSTSIVLTADDVPYEEIPLTRAGFENLMKSLKSINDNAEKFFNSGYVSSFVHDMMCFWYEDFSVLQKEYHSYPPTNAQIKVRMKSLISRMLGLMFISRMPGGDWQMIIKEYGHKPVNADEQSDILKGWIFKKYGEIKVLIKFMNGNAGDCTRAAREMYDWLLQKFGMMTRLPDWTVLKNCGIISH